MVQNRGGPNSADTLREDKIYRPTTSYYYCTKLTCYLSQTRELVTEQKVSSIYDLLEKL